MKKLILVLFGTLLSISSICQNTGTRPVIMNRPNATIYAVPKDIEFPAFNREVYDYSYWKKKSLTKSTELPIVDVTNSKKDLCYDKYVVQYKNKLYLIDPGDTYDSSFIERKNNELLSFQKQIQDSLRSLRHLSDSTFDALMFIISKAEEPYKNKIRDYRKNKDSIVFQRIWDYTQEEAISSRENRKHYYEWANSLPQEGKIAAKALVITESDIEVGYYGVCDYRFNFINLSPKVIKYLYWSGRAKNAVGDFITCDINHSSTISGQYTGPCYEFQNTANIWEAILVNSSANEMVLSSIRIVYMDGSSLSIGKKAIEYLMTVPKSEIALNCLWSQYEDFTLDNLSEEVEKDYYLRYKKEEIEKDLIKQQRNYQDTINLFGEVKGYATTYQDNPSAFRSYLLKSKYSFFKYNKDYYRCIDRYTESKNKEKEYIKQESEFNLRNLIK